MEKELSLSHLVSVLPYFFSLPEKAVERDLERALVSHIQEFLLELGVGFAFVGSQYRLEVGGEEFFIDMLFVRPVDLKTNLRLGRGRTTRSPPVGV